MVCDVNVCNFADDTTPFVCAQKLENVMMSLEEYSEISIYWFELRRIKHR